MKTKYGLKALLYLSRKAPEVPVLISEIAEAEHISKKFLESILLILKKEHILSSKKGKGGGYFLMRSPHEIKIATVIRILEGPIAMLPCVSLNYYKKCDDCVSEEACSVHGLMAEVRDSTLKILENKTLADFHLGKDPY